MELLALLLFSLILIACVTAGLSILYALVCGYFIFAAYAYHKGYTPRQILHMSLSGINTTKNILITFVLIGMLTASWRAAGTIPSIVFYAVGFMKPSVMVLMTFLLNCMVSFLIGTSFGTAATMGVICMTMSLAMGLNPAVIGGAILAGCYFGDRCSPVSTSALLIAELTKTDIFENIKGLMKSAAVPFLLSCAIYAALGLLLPQSVGISLDARQLFAQSFRLGWLTLLPAVVILLFSLLRISVRRTMIASITVSTLICLFYQRLGLGQVISMLIGGYRSNNPQLSSMIDGGGILSMVTVTAIICISSCYAGIFKETGLLYTLEQRVVDFSEKTSPYTAILLTAIASGIIACNQILTIMLTQQICDSVQPDNKKLAIELANTAVVIPPLVPWSIAGAVPMATVGAPSTALLAACYLYLLPLWSLMIDTSTRKRKNKVR